jgi:tetratricopeptide (TPR) repeat protein/predicted Ser/Thr protein kinase
MEDNLVRCGSCGNVVSGDLLTEEFSGACPWCMAGLSTAGSGRRPTAIEELSPRAGPLPCDDPVAEMPSEALDAPEVAGRYRRVQKLGEGGMGQVWKAWDKRLGRWVALKFLKEADERDLAWFQREAHVAATLAHPHIAAIHDIGEDAGHHYIAMQYVEGRTLEKLDRADARRIASLLRDAARGVAHAHAQGIIHRDLKPANFMITGADHLYVMDFGLARRIDSPSPYSMPGEAAGTPVYMSPAQAKGETLDARDDVYSLGATMYELLAGKPPIEGVSIHELIKKARESNFRPLAKAAPSAPAELVSIVTKCLSPDSAARYATAAELADDLDRWLEGKPVAAHSSGVAYRARKFAAKQLFAVGALVAALGIVAVFGLRSLQESRKDAAYGEAMAKGQAAWEEVVRYTSGSSMPEHAAKKAADARAHFEAALRIRDRGQAHLMKGRCLQIEGRLEDAIASWQQAQDVEDAKFEEAKAVILKYQTARGKPPGTIGRSANVPDGVTRFKAEKDTRPETAEQKDLRERAEGLLKGVDAAAHKNKLLLGMMAVSKYEFEEGAKLLAEYTKAEPWDAQAMRLEATAWYYCNRPKEALGAINRALERTQDARSFWLLGKIRIGADDDDGAIEAFGKAIALDPKDVAFYQDRGFPYWRTGKYKEMEENATRVIELEPKEAAGYHTRSMARGVLGNLEGQLADIDKVIELEPTKPGGYHLRGLFKNRKRDHDGAIADLTKSLELAAGNPRATRHALDFRIVVYRNKAAALKDLGREAEARAVLKDCILDQRRVLAEEPDDIMGRAELSETLRLVGETAESEKELADAVGRNREVVGNYFAQNAHRNYVQKQWARSLDGWRRSIDIDPLRAGQRPIYLWLTRAWAGERDAATAELIDQIDMKKMFPDPWDAKLADFLAGRLTEEALFEATKADEEKAARGRRTEAYCFAAEVRALSGDAAGAKDLYRLAVEQDRPDFLEHAVARRRLADLK